MDGPMARAIVKAFEDRADFADLEHSKDRRRVITLMVPIELRALQSLKRCLDQIERFFPSKERPPTTDRLVTDDMPSRPYAETNP